MITETQLQKWERLANEATPGPWMNYEQAKKRLDIGWNDWFSILAYSESGKPFILCSSNGAMTTAKAKEEARLKEDCPEPEGQTKRDMAFIAVARYAVPALIDEVRRLEEHIKILGKDRSWRADYTRRIEYEADWLANKLSLAPENSCPRDDSQEYPCNSAENVAHDCVLCWRKAAKKAVERMNAKV